MSRMPPRSQYTCTSFPYPPLFRSQLPHPVDVVFGAPPVVVIAAVDPAIDEPAERGGAFGDRHVEHRARVAARIAVFGELPRRPRAAAARVEIGRHRLDADDAPQRADRKSTRLNSSH